MNNHIDDQLLMDLANQLGMDPGASTAASGRAHTPTGSSGSSPYGQPKIPADSRQQALAMAEAMKGKSENEILSEIMKVKAQLQKTPGAYEKQIRAVKSLRGMMNPEQRKRLDQVLNLLER